MEYLALLFGASAVVGVCTALAHNELSRFTSLALGILLALAIASPLSVSLSGIFSGDLELDFGEADGGKFDEITTAAFEDGVASAVMAWCGIAEESVRVTSRGFDPTDMRADSVTVILPTDSLLVDYRALRDYVSENFTRDGTCEVVYG